MLLENGIHKLRNILKTFISIDINIALYWHYYKISLSESNIFISIHNVE